MLGGVRRRATLACSIAAALIALAAAPASSHAQTVSFVNSTDISIPGIFTGPATPYPSTIGVAGLAGTVTKTSVVLLDLDAGGQIEALDLVLVGPNGGKVMLWSDACGNVGFDDRDYSFDDAAGMFLSDPGPCAAGGYKPSNYEDPALDNLSGGGGPAPPYTNSLGGAFNGISPNGNWGLFAYSDINGDFIRIGAWALTLAIQPPAPANPQAPSVTTTATGQRAAALAKCKKKRGKARRKCKRRAQQLPL